MLWEHRQGGRSKDWGERWLVEAREGFWGGIKENRQSKKSPVFWAGVANGWRWDRQRNWEQMKAAKCGCITGGVESNAARGRQETAPESPGNHARHIGLIWRGCRVIGGGDRVSLGLFAEGHFSSTLRKTWSGKKHTKDNDVSYQDITAEDHCGLDKRRWTQRQKCKRCEVYIEDWIGEMRFNFTFCLQQGYIFGGRNNCSLPSVKTPLISSLESFI